MSCYRATKYFEAQEWTKEYGEKQKKITKTSFIVDIVVKCSQVIASAVTFNAYVTHFKQSPVYADNCGTERVRIEH